MADTSLVRMLQLCAALMVPEVKKSIKMTPFASQNTVSTTFPAECDTLNFLVTGELGCFHVIKVDVHPCLIACDDPEKKLRDEEVRRAVENFLHSLSTDFHQDGFLKLISQYNKCINVGGEYVEK
ncbi:hypothetical protein AVEN_159039-1 [Araneus ventricosus]|uniref:Uncharacterized protein n=1 Tax=Araneus ventricosus TaxID=182803 RepID=A0A4Y2BST0_ARAVE|nr:hypothetical protein AVEN_159039-1 [Araneus ventricosus]